MATSVVVVLGLVATIALHVLFHFPAETPDTRRARRSRQDRRLQDVFECGAGRSIKSHVSAGANSRSLRKVLAVCTRTRRRASLGAKVFRHYRSRRSGPWHRIVCIFAIVVFRRSMGRTRCSGLRKLALRIVLKRDFVLGIRARFEWRRRRRIRWRRRRRRGRRWRLVSRIPASLDYNGPCKSSRRCWP